MGSPDGSLVANRQRMTALGAAAAQHGLAIFALHAGAESMSFGALTVVRLKRSLWHVAYFGAGDRPTRILCVKSVFEIVLDVKSIANSRTRADSSFGLQVAG